MNAMTESPELHEKVDRILQGVESMDNLMPWIIKPHAKEIRDQMIKYLEKQVSVVRVFLEVDGVKTVSDIKQKLNMQMSNVSRELGKLREMGIIEPKSVGNSTVYQKTKIDKVIGLSKELEKMIQEIDTKKTTEVTINEESTGNGNNSTIGNTQS